MPCQRHRVLGPWVILCKGAPPFRSRLAEGRRVESEARRLTKRPCLGWMTLPTARRSWRCRKSALVARKPIPEMLRAVRSLRETVRQFLHGLLQQLDKVEGSCQADRQ